MNDASIILPAGYRLLRLAEIGSTNTEALRLAALGEASGLWVMADAQIGGRGRSGRVWTSRAGNLHATLLLRRSAPLGIAQQLSLLAPVALHDAITTVTGGIGDMRLKWPNDVLLNGAKLSGILIESSGAGSSTGLVIVLGLGINVSYHPAGLDQAATNLGQQGHAVSVESMMTALAASMDRWLRVWSEGAGFAAVRAAWLERAGPIGETLSVRDGASRITGRYQGLDQTGALLLQDDAGEMRRFSNGQVALGSQAR